MIVKFERDSVERSLHHERRPIRGMCAASEEPTSYPWGQALPSPRVSRRARISTDAAAPDAGRGIYGIGRLVAQLSAGFEHPAPDPTRAMIE